MNMKLIRSGSCILLACCMTQMAAQPMPCPATPDTLISPAAVRKEKAAPSDVNRYIRGWNRIIPRHFKTQFAGGSGLLSVGIGWHYGKYHDTFETDFLLGFLPRYTTGSPHAVLTLKQTFRPWHIHIPQKRLVLSPFRTGLFLTTITGNEFWRHQPSKYQDGYYWFSTRIRTHLFVGQSLQLRTPQFRIPKSIELYYELSTNDLYLLNSLLNRYIRFRDIISLAIGLKLEML